MTPSACIKTERFVDLANTFHLPIVYFADVPGFMVGPESEAAGIIRFANRAAAAVREASVPYISIVIRRMYGVASVVAKSDGMSVRYAWPSAESGSLVAQGGVMAAYRREIEAAPDPVARRLEIEERFQRMASVLRQPGLARPLEITSRHPACNRRLSAREPRGERNQTGAKVARRHAALRDKKPLHIAAGLQTSTKGKCELRIVSTKPIAIPVLALVK